MAATLESRAYTVTLPPELAQRAEYLAARESRTMSELLCEALRAYYAKWIETRLDEVGKYADSRNPGYTEADVPRLIAEVRAESEQAALAKAGD